jgi:hypothetical protein
LYIDTHSTLARASGDSGRRGSKSSYDGSNVMNGKIAVVLLSGSLLACVQAQPPAASVAAPPPAAVPAPAPTQVAAAMPEAAPAGDCYVTIRSARCATLLGLPEDDRAAASLFYIGYQASRLGARSIHVNAIPATESEALNYCRTFPNRTVAEAFAKAFLRVLR